MKKVGVITRTKNRPILLERALESVRKQTYKSLVWVIVNDGGEETPVNMIVDKAKRLNIDVCVIHNKYSSGMEAASNIGIRSCNSEFLIIHDDDDSWEENFLKEAVDFMEKEENSHYSGVVTHSWRVDEKIIDNKQCVVINKYSFNSDLQCVYLMDMAKNNLYPPISFLYKREIYEKVGGYNEELPVLGDWDFNLKFMLYGEIGVIPRCLANYHHRVKSMDKEYGNTVIQGVEKHIQYDAVLRNKLLKDDIQNNKVGLGYLVNIGRDNKLVLQMMNEKASAYQDIKKILKQQGIKGLVKKLVKH